MDSKWSAFDRWCHCIDYNPSSLLRCVSENILAVPAGSEDLDAYSIIFCITLTTYSMYIIYSHCSVNGKDDRVTG